MFRTLRLIAVLLAAVASYGATLQQLSMDQMAQSATSIVRARVVSSTVTQDSAAGGSLYTHYKLDVSEVWKGSAAAEVMLPGGDLNGRRQSFPGVPELRVGGDYVLFLWKSPTTGVVHALGLTQGIFEVTTQADGSVTANRRQTGELMLDAAGRRVADQAITMKLADMKARARQ